MYNTVGFTSEDLGCTVGFERFLILAPFVSLNGELVNIEISLRGGKKTPSRFEFILGFFRSLFVVRSFIASVC